LSQIMSDSQLILCGFIIFCKFLLMIFTVVVATFYFKRHEKAPKLIILYMLVILTINGIIYFASINSIPNFVPNALRVFVWSLIMSCIYIPYLLTSDEIKMLFSSSEAS